MQVADSQQPIGLTRTLRPTTLSYKGMRMGVAVSSRRYQQSCIASSGPLFCAPERSMSKQSRFNRCLFLFKERLAHFTSMQDRLSLRNRCPLDDSESLMSIAHTGSKTKSFPDARTTRTRGRFARSAPFVRDDISTELTIRGSVPIMLLVRDDEDVYQIAIKIPCG